MLNQIEYVYVTTISISEFVLKLNQIKRKENG